MCVWAEEWQSVSNCVCLLRIWRTAAHKGSALGLLTHGPSHVSGCGLTILVAVCLQQIHVVGDSVIQVIVDAPDAGKSSLVFKMQQLKDDLPKVIIKVSRASVSVQTSHAQTSNVKENRTRDSQADVARLGAFMSNPTET